MTPDPRWLEILKASSWQLGAISIGLAAFWLMLHFGVLPPIEATWVVYGVPLAFLVCGGMSLAGLFEHLSKFLSSALAKRRERIDLAATIEHEKSELAQYIPFMTEQEKAIIGYLLEKRQKVFTAETDASGANTLYARRFVRLAMKGSQPVDPLAVPFHIPDHLWLVLEENKDTFPTGLANSERPPWRTGYW